MSASSKQGDPWLCFSSHPGFWLVSLTAKRASCYLVKFVDSMIARLDLLVQAVAGLAAGAGVPSSSALEGFRAVVGFEGVCGAGAATLILRICAIAAAAASGLALKEFTPRLPKACTGALSHIWGLIGKFS